MLENPNPIEETRRTYQAIDRVEALAAELTVGDPRFMAFWDLADLGVTKWDLQHGNHTNSAVQGFTDENDLKNKVALIEARISGRFSETPGYFKAFKELRFDVDRVAAGGFKDVLWNVQNTVAGK